MKSFSMCRKVMSIFNFLPLFECRRMTRKHVLCANTQFTCVQFFPTGVQVLATGTDRKISYWEVFDGSLVRHIEGSSKGCINWLSINSSGEMFVSGGVDQIVKVCLFNALVITLKFKYI